MGLLQLDIMTPAREALRVACENVYMPADDGEMGILESHESYVTLMGTGVVRIQKTDGSQALCVRGGFIEVSDNNVTLLADEVTFEDEIDAAALQTKLDEVSQALLANNDSAIKQAQLLDQQKWLSTQLAFANAA